MLIAIDYDGTWTRDPIAWRYATFALQSTGHTVVVCTGRAFPPADLHTDMAVHCTAGQAKRDYLASLGLRPDVWIDDDPQSILTDDPSTRP